MSMTDAQGQPTSESATNLCPNKDLSISSHTLPHPQPYLVLLHPSHFQAQPSSQQPLALPDMTSLSSVPRMDSQTESILPACHALPYAHLPTPQSPNNLARYVGDHSQTPQSPLPNLSQASDTPSASSSYQRQNQNNGSGEDTPSRSHGSKQCATPESSPSHGPRVTPTRVGFVASTRNNFTDSGTLTPKNHHPSVVLDLTALGPSAHISSPVSTASGQSSRLSSPFIAKLAVAERSAKRKQTLSAPASPIPMDVDDVFSSPLPSIRARIIKQEYINMSSPPISPPQASTSTTGGEIERIRQALIEDHLEQIREVESRRPDYLKRSKRPVSDIDTAMFIDEREQERERGFAVGITESPNKGRRLKLFQETSEESFEESLMAGGYGRYRTNDWVRQPQPLAVLGSSAAGAPNVADILVERAEAAPPTEKELKKRKRLEAFRSNNSVRSKLTPVDIMGKGRVLLELPDEDKPIVPTTPESSPSKKRSGGKRKRKSGDFTPGKDKPSSLSEVLEGPNWPDDEFPWRLRKEEHSEAEKALEEERLKWVDKYLGRDTDDEDDDGDGIRTVEEILPSAKWGHVYEHETDKPIPVRMGRGKMVPLLAYPDDPRNIYAKKSVFPSDPADARAALLAKKSVRALAYRNQRKRRELTDECDDDTLICICNGKDDGRELVQCDSCQTWFHLQCIGIRNIAELGREEDAWFCRSCMTRIRSPSPEQAPRPIVSREPTFVPTDDAPRIRSQDPTLYQPLQNSPLWNPPRMPKTPTRSGRRSDFDRSSSSDYSRLPSTPHNPSHDVRLYNTPGPFDYRPSDDPPFDPNTTPSRGIKFGAFTTPKSNPWSIRAGGLFHTPSRHHSRGSFGRSFGSMEDMGGSFGAFDGLTRYPNVEDSPIRHNVGKDGPRIRKIAESPLLSRPLVPLRPAPEESPVVRFQSQRDLPRFPGFTGHSPRDDSAYMR